MTLQVSNVGNDTPVKPLFQEGEHEVHAVKMVQVSNGAIAVVLRCCDDKTTDYPHTLYRVHELADEDIDAKLQVVAKDAADLHRAVLRAKSYIEKNHLRPSSVPVDESAHQSSMTHL